jgi:hypothetical protein
LLEMAPEAASYAQSWCGSLASQGAATTLAN